KQKQGGRFCSAASGAGDGNMSANPKVVSGESILLREDAGGVVTLTLNRPAQFNSLSLDLLAALQSELDRIGRDPQARVVVIAGAGRAFCARRRPEEVRSGS